MDTPRFQKNDQGFICECCKSKIPILGYTSRDHCTKCLVSLHVDINPGDRRNNCKGQMIPTGIRINNKKGYIIEYKCSVCGDFHSNKAAEDDDFETLLKVMNHTFKVDDYRKKDVSTSV